MTYHTFSEFISDRFSRYLLILFEPLIRNMVLRTTYFKANAPKSISAAFLSLTGFIAQKHQADPGAVIIPDHSPSYTMAETQGGYRNIFLLHFRLTS